MDWIGEISLMKDLTATMDITMAAEEEAAAAAAAAEANGENEYPGTAEATKESMKTAGEGSTSAAAGPSAAGEKEKPPTVVVEEEPAPAYTEKPSNEAKPSASAPSSGRSTPRPGARTQIPIRPALMDRPSDEGDDVNGAERADTDLKRKEKEKKSKGLSKEQREQLAALDKERARIRQERVETLARKLLDRISIWTETDKGPDVTKAFQEKMRLEVEDLKMESFGLDILHAIGQTYVSKATVLLRSQKFFGMGGFFSRMKDKGALVKDTWNTISSAIDAQQSMEEMARMEQEGGEEWTDEKKMEYERRVTGKILTAAWRGSKFEIQSVLREVCDEVLGDKKVPQAKRLERAQALILIGEICAKVRTELFKVSFTHRYYRNTNASTGQTVARGRGRLHGF